MNGMPSPSRRSGSGSGLRVPTPKPTSWVAFALWATLNTLVCDGGSALADRPEVLVEQGLLRGQWVQGVAGTEGQYAAFRGIPYAQPPLGPLRFKNPKPPDSWDGTRSATTEGAECPQGSETMTGSEDCLYLNVYTPSLPGNESMETTEPPSPGLSVLFHVHGGGFYSGSGGAIDLGPDLLIQHGIVIATANYRLGPLGFANLNTEGIPGNAGLKDLQAALYWLKRNVAAFGGDPNKLTVSGHNAGAAAAHFLALVPSSSGLARALILHSGNALSSWAYTEDNVQYATELASRIDPTLDNDTLDYDAIEEVLRNATIEELLAEFYKMKDARQHRVGFSPFIPSPERRSRQESNQEVFLSRDPESLLLDRAAPPLPTLMGITSQEALADFCRLKWDLLPEEMEVYNNELQHLLPLNLWPAKDTSLRLGLNHLNSTELNAEEVGPPPVFPPDIDSVVERIREEYFGSEDITNSSQQVVELLNDVSVNADVNRLATLLVSPAATATYLYQFSAEGDYNLGRARRRVDRPGAVNTDELGYLWRVEGLGQNYSAHSLEGNLTRWMTTIWTNFVKTEQPMVDDTPLAWPPTSAHILPSQTFMDISDTPALRVANLGGSHMNFWKNLYSDLRKSDAQ